MATMHPSDIDTIVFAAESEREVYCQLARQLHNKCHVFYSVRWQYLENQSNKMGEADFVVLDPDNGVLVLECKGGYKIEYNSGKWVLWNNSYGSYRILTESPYSQAQKSMFSFAKHYEQKYNVRFPATYAHAVIFPYYDVPEDLCPERTSANTIQYSDMSCLASKINHIFHANRHGNMLFAQREFEHMFSMLDGDTESIPAIGALCQRGLQELQELATTQSHTLSLLQHYDKAVFVGPAGCGKTWLAIQKARGFAELGLRTLYVCFNRLNAQNVKLQCGSDKSIDCYTFHQLIKKTLGFTKYNLLVRSDASLPTLRTELNGISIELYDAIIVDEAQDMEKEWATILCHFFLKNETTSKLYVFYDEEQNIFGRDFGEAFSIQYPPFVLRQNCRNTQTIWKWITEKTELGRVGICNNVVGVSPQIVQVRNRNMAISWLENKVRELINCGIHPGDITILSNSVWSKSCLSSVNSIAGIPIADITNEEIFDDQIAFCTVQAFKGLESPVVICLFSDGSIDSKLEYVAYSRAKCLLYVLKT